MKDTVRMHIYVEGEVQGVFFRDWTRQRAEELGVILENIVTKEEPHQGEFSHFQIRYHE